MESESKTTGGSGALGSDNAEILASKHRRESAGAQQLRAQLRGTSSTNAAPAARPAASRPTNAAPAARPAAPRPANAASAARPAASRPTNAAPAARPAAPRPANAASAARPAALRPANAASAARPAETQRQELPANASASRAALPAASRKKHAQGSAPTRVTDISGIRAVVRQCEAETRLTDIKGLHAQKRQDAAPPEEEMDESEGGNTVISIIKAITYIVAVVVVSVFLAFFVILVGNDVYAFVKDDTVTEVTIPEYATLNDVSEILAERKIIKYPTIFKLYANLKKDDGQFLAGEYSLTPMMNYEELLSAFKPKKPSGISRITIPEGYTTDEIIDLFVSKGIGTRERYVDVINNYDFDYWFVDELEENGIPEGRFYRLDGYLFPDTYEVYNASSEETVINKLLRRFNEIYSSSYVQKAQDIGYTVDQVLTLASMIEKEAGSQSDFFDVSSVFNNRLKNAANFPYMESDATVVYAIQHDTGERVNPSAQDMTYDSPYNTYTHKGLPPGPIANPSASAIRAALYPSETKYYYFVSASSRVTYFATTLEEHNKNIEKIKNGEITALPEETAAN